MSQGCGVSLPPAKLTGTGDVAGPASSTDNAIARYNGTTGKTLQDSGLTISDNDELTVKRTIQDTVIASDGATVTFDLQDGNLQQVTIAGNRILALTNESNGVFGITIVQDGSGSRTVAWWAGIKWAGGSAPTLTTTGGKADTMVFIRRGAADFLGFVVGQNL